METPGLFGLTNSNRDFSDPYYWGKNQFNSSFPAALACYMRSQSICAILLELDETREISQREATLDEVFNTSLANEEIEFSFESRYEPFNEFLHDELKPIDLVLRNASNGTPLRPLEIKLTTLPDNSTAKLTDDKFGTEMVVRSPTMRYMALSMVDSCRDSFEQIREIFEPCCHRIRNWDNSHEVGSQLDSILEALENFFSTYSGNQRPILMQPVWKTIGTTAKLADNCLDLFVWTDFALSRLFMESAKNNTGNKITRVQRAALRLARFLYEVSINGKVYQAPIYDGMTFDTLNDKEFAISGIKMNPLISCSRLTDPIISKDEIKNIILGGGQKYLSPERRFDAIIYFSTDIFDEDAQ